MEFARLVEVEDVWEEAGIPIKIKLLLLHVIVIAHLQEGRKTGGQREGRMEISSKITERQTPAPCRRMYE